MDSTMIVRILAGILVLVLCLLYFYPTFKAMGKRNTGAIFALNLLTGWSTIGWVVALIWALKNDAVALRPDEVEQFKGRDRQIKAFIYILLSIFAIILAVIMMLTSTSPSSQPNTQQSAVADQVSQQQSMVINQQSAPAVEESSTPSSHPPGKTIKWTAMSHTAEAITGDVLTSPNSISMMNNSYPLAFVRDLHGDELDDSAKMQFLQLQPSQRIEGRLFRTTIPATANLINGNTICGTDSAEWILVITTSKEGTGSDADNWLYLAFFSGDAEPVIQTQALERSKALCGTYNYQETTSLQ